MNIKQVTGTRCEWWRVRLIYTQSIFFLCTGCTLAGCTYKYKRTTDLKNGLYIESYFAGPLGYLTADYLTDSTTFRIHIGTYDEENGWFYYRCNGDSIIVRKMDDSERALKPKVVDETVYSLSRLRKFHGWLK